MNPIENAVLPRKQAAIDRATAAMVQVIEKACKEIEAAGFDLKIAAPHPHGNMSRKDYVQARAKVGFFSRISSPTKTSRSMREPNIVTISQEGIQRVLKETSENAAAEFDAYVAKLTAKVGPCAIAKINEAPLWNGSKLAITREDGTLEFWKTTMILNVSCLGKLFNQWPTRKL